MPRVIQISDPHVVAPPNKVSGRIDSARMLKEAVDRIKADMPKIGPVDAILVTGDISDDGSGESYALFRALLEPLGLPFYVIPGNHDLREPMRSAFSDQTCLPPVGRLNWSVALNTMHLIGLDTLQEGQGGGILDTDTLVFLRQALADAGQGPVFLAMHHPPFASGIKFMDSIGLDGTDSLVEILNATEADVRILCGHVHHVMIAGVGSAVAISGPSTCSTFDADFRHDAPIGFMSEPGGFMVHDWLNGFRSIHIGPGQGEGPYPF